MEFVNGLYFTEPKAETRDWNFGRISIVKGKFEEWLKNQKADEKGYIKIKINKSKAGKIYMAIDDWKPDFYKKPLLGEIGEVKIEDVPF